MSIRRIPFITIGLMEIPPNGRSQLIARVEPDDHQRICDAAKAIGMNQAQFLRTVLVRSADVILEEIGEVKESMPGAL